MTEMIRTALADLLLRLSKWVRPKRGGGQGEE